MNLGIRRKSRKSNSKPQAVQTVSRQKEKDLFGFGQYEKQSKAERELYSSLREAVPVIDAAICKTVRLIGKFRIVTDDLKAQKIADSFMKNVRTNASSRGMLSFIYTYFDELITYGEAVGEMMLDSSCSSIASLYNASLDDVEIAAGSSPLELVVCRNDCGTIKPVKNQSLVFASLLNPKAGTVYGTSIMRGLPFVSSILLRIFESLKTNWERMGDIRFAVTYNPEQNGSFSKESAKVIADEWQKAMRSDRVCDFVSVGNVSVKVIGAESQMPDCEVPIKQIMEQILAKLGIPPFLLGISWSSTERMSQQQADILTSELEYYRTVLEPVINKIISTELKLNGYNCDFKIEWENINLQDSVELSKARLNNAYAMQIEKEIGMGVIDE